MEVDPNAVLARLSKQIGDLTIRLAVAEARAEHAERQVVDLLADKEGADVEQR